jgi:hypothetical protein
LLTVGDLIDEEQPVEFTAGYAATWTSSMALL